MKNLKNPLLFVMPNRHSADWTAITFGRGVLFMIMSIVIYSKKIQLTQGKFTQVSYWWYHFLNQWFWYAANDNGNRYYAVRTVKFKSGKRYTVKMHRAILKIDDIKIHGDHKDRDSLNNTEGNLRAANHSESMRNRRAKIATSKFKGVSFCKLTHKWRAIITINKTSISLGFYADETVAALVYNQAAIKYHGEFANLNII